MVKGSKGSKGAKGKRLILPTARFERCYGGIFKFVVPATRFVIFITSAITMGMCLSGAVQAKASHPDDRADPLEVMGAILGAFSLLHSIAGLIPGTKITPLQRLGEGGAALTVAYVIFIIGVMMTTGELGSKGYIASFDTKEGRMWNSMAAGMVSALGLLCMTVLDFFKNRSFEKMAGESATGAYLENAYPADDISTYSSRGSVSRI